LISFVVPAYNEERYLGATLASIHAAALAVAEPYEIVVADDASTDATVAIAEANNARVVRVEKRQIAATRNAGARASSGDPLFFVDADTRVNEAVLRAALRALDDGAVGGGAAVEFDDVPAWAHLAMRVAVPAFRALNFAAGCFVFCRREAFEAVGGFDETLFAAEEIIISRALARRGRFVVVREKVVTSGRKVHAHGFWKMHAVMLVMAVRGWRGVKSRRHAAFWYEDKR